MLPASLGSEPQGEMGSRKPNRPEAGRAIQSTVLTTHVTDPDLGEVQAIQSNNFPPRKQSFSQELDSEHRSEPRCWATSSHLCSIMCKQLAHCPADHSAGKVLGQERAPVDVPCGRDHGLWCLARKSTASSWCFASSVAQSNTWSKKA